MLDKRRRVPAFELVTPPDELRRRALVAEGSVEAGVTEAVARGERALGRLASDLAALAQRSVGRLGEAHERWRTSQRDADREAFFRIAHDLRGEAASLGYPLVGRLCASLCRLLGDERLLAVPLIDAHMDAVRAAAREGAGEDDPVGSALAAELERLCGESLSKGRAGALRRRP